MRAAVATGYGSVDVLKIADVPVPKAGPKELLIQVYSSALNPIDYKIRQGLFQGVMPRTFPYILGFDTSGVVAEVGEGVTRLRAGDEVYLSNDLAKNGSNAEFCIADETIVAKKPPSLSHEAASSIPLVGLTAWQCLKDFVGLKPGEKVLIHAGAGGVGSFAIQLAKAWGATVLTTASRQNHDYVKSLGADVAIDYREEDFVKVCEKHGGVDAIFDTMGGEILKNGVAAVRERGRIVSIVEQPDNQTLAQCEQRGIRAGFVLRTGSGAQLEEISTLIENKKIRPFVFKILPLEDIKKAHQLSESHHTKGKIVLNIR